MTRTSSQCVDQTGIVRPCASRWNFVGRRGRPTLCITFKETKKWTSAADNCKKARRDARPTFGLSYAGCAQTGGGLEEFGYIHSCGVCSVRGCKSCWHSFVFPQCLGSTITESFLSQQASKHTATCQVHQRGFESPNGSRHSASATFICINRWTEVMKLHGAYQQWLSLAFSLSYKEKGVVWLSERRYSGLSFLFFHTFMWYCICKKKKNRPWLFKFRPTDWRTNDRFNTRTKTKPHGAGRTQTSTETLVGQQGLLSGTLPSLIQIENSTHLKGVVHKNNPCNNLRPFSSCKRMEEKASSFQD